MSPDKETGSQLCSTSYSAEIAAELHLAESTVKGYLSEVLTCRNLRECTQLVVRAYESGLVPVGDAAATDGA